MDKILFSVSLFILISCTQTNKQADSSRISSVSDSALADRAIINDYSGLNSGNIIWLDKPAPEWAEGYPVGNGRLGGMVLGGVPDERISVNHDLLWRQFWSYQEHKTASDIKKIRELSVQGKWDEADDVMLKKIPASGNAIYVNPYVPAGDLYINLRHRNSPVTDYRRVLYMDRGIAEVAIPGG